jgi:hypothetical protein
MVLSAVTDAQSVCTVIKLMKKALGGFGQKKETPKKKMS